MARRQQRTARRLEIATPDPPNYRDFTNYLDIATSALMARLNEPPVAPAPSADSLEVGILFASPSRLMLPPISTPFHCPVTDGL